MHRNPVTQPDPAELPEDAEETLVTALNSLPGPDAEDLREQLEQLQQVEIRNQKIEAYAMSLMSPLLMGARVYDSDHDMVEDAFDLAELFLREASRRRVAVPESLVESAIRGGTDVD